MEFLPYHYLLAAMREFRFLTWLDISVGRITFEVRTEDRQNNAVCQNPQTAMMMIGQGNGVVSMWSPNAGKPMVKMMCLPCPITAVSVDTKGTLMATAGANRMVKMWDLRNYKCLHSYRLPSPASHMSISQSDQLALSMGSVINIYKDVATETWSEPYMYHKLKHPASRLQFCPYEDVLGVGHRSGFTSLIVPGAGEANFDALESNPFQTKSQRRETEIKTLLDKVPPDLITVDPTQVKQVDVPSLEELMEEKKKEYPLANLPKLEFEPRHKTRRKSTSVRVYQRKKKVQEAHKRETLKKIKSKDERSKTEETGDGEEGNGSAPKRKKPGNVLDRFKPKARR
jgi:U3 small nucleolar RNA-associated protein 7